MITIRNFHLNVNLKDMTASMSDLTHLVPKLFSVGIGRFFNERVDTRSNGAFVGQVSGDASLVLRRGSTDEGGVVDEAVLGGVAFGLQSSRVVGR